MFLLGPAEYFAVNLVGGPVYVEPLTGRVPSILVVRPMRQGFTTSTVQVSCGDQIFDTMVGLAASEWVVRFFAWQRWTPEGSPADWDAALAAEPLDTLHSGEVDFWWGGQQPTDSVPPEQFITVGETSLNLPAGSYVAHVIADDGVRIFVDDRPVLTRWTRDFVRYDRGSFSVSTGVHRFRVEHFQAQGSSWLQFWIDQ